MTKLLYGNSEKSFLKCEKMETLKKVFSNAKKWFKKTFSGTFSARTGSRNFSFLKNSLVQVNSKLNPKPYDYPY